MANLREWQSRELALSQGLRAGWSEPLLSRDGELLATFALYLGTARRPTESELC